MIEVLVNELANFGDLSESEQEIYNESLVAAFNISKMMESYRKHLEFYLYLGLVGLNKNGRQDNQKLTVGERAEIKKELIRIKIK